jgi:Uncharacterized protein conserved in bacteria (DUF2188)
MAAAIPRTNAMQENVFIVYPGALWGWEVIRDGHDDEPACFDERRPAVEYARAMAIAMSPGEVRIEDARGFVRVTWKTRSGQEVRP